ncbi:MAG TPA: hypothetical protein VF691_06170, partial [Cytophagaceae bacterium]
MKKHLYRKHLSLLSLCLFSALINAFGQTATVSIDATKTYQKITGFGSHGWVDDRTLELEPAFYRIVVDREYAGELEEAGNDNNDPNVLNESAFTWSSESIDWAKKVY